jgi:hypothetical protein
MPGVSKLSWRACWPLLPALLAGLLALGLGQRRGGSGPPGVPLEDWDIPRLLAHLNGEGLRLRVVATQHNGATQHTAFLTTTDKAWAELNRLTRDEKRIDEWRGTLHCERGPGRDDWASLTGQWGERCLVVGPFLLYGDRQLLARVRAALKPLLR